MKAAAAATEVVGLSDRNVYGDRPASGQIGVDSLNYRRVNISSSMRRRRLQRVGAEAFGFHDVFPIRHVAHVVGFGHNPIKLEFHGSDIDNVSK